MSRFSVLLVAGWWHRLLLALHIRDEFDYAAPGLGPEVPHAYEKHPQLRCCEYCGGGRLHAIHRPPFDRQRMKEIEESRAARYY